MIVFLLLVVVVLVALTAAAVMGKIGGFLADPTSTQSFGGVSSGSLSSNDIAELHFDQALRGYRMSQVDEVIDALSARLSELEAKVAVSPAESGSSPSVGDEPGLSVERLEPPDP